MPATHVRAEAPVENLQPVALQSVNLSKGFQRLPQLDTLRGFLLVWMTLTHLPTRVSAYSNQVVGYVSAAEGFILLAAILVARIHGDAGRKLGAPAANHRLWWRVTRIYSYHLALLGFAFTVCAAAATYFHRIPLQNLLDYYLLDPKRALLAAPALLYNPPLLDILPMYIVFMALTPLVIRAAERWTWSRVLSVSGCVWLLAQFHLREWVYAAASHFGFAIPLREMGAFDLFGWQFLWIIGLYLGSGNAAALFSNVRIPKWIVRFSIVVAVLMFVLRHTGFDVIAGPTLFDALVNKWRLGIFRLFDAAAITILLVKFGSPLASTRLGMQLAVLGRASLEVFSSHVILCLIFLGLATGTDPHFAAWQDPIVLFITLASLFLVARFVDRRRKLARSARTASVTLSPRPVTEG